MARVHAEAVPVKGHRRNAAAGEAVGVPAPRRLPQLGPDAGFPKAGFQRPGHAFPGSHAQNRSADGLARQIHVQVQPVLGPLLLPAAQVGDAALAADLLGAEEGKFQRPGGAVGRKVPADLVDNRYIPIYRELGRDRFLALIENESIKTPEQAKKLVSKYKEMDVKDVSEATTGKD